ncbi:MAG: GAF domain-containing sensor histidine kinase [Anaerolineae bacterium]|nr:GAF domain-containing sensor histidine kinase [Anaerolineae bacterium]
MSKKYMRWLSVIAPVLFWVSVFVASGYLYGEHHTWQEIAFTSVSIMIGAVLFTYWVFGYVDQREGEIKRRAEQLESLNTASLALTTELDIGLVLQKVVDLSRELGQARYGALGVLSDDGEYFEQFISSGIPPDKLEMLRQPPQNQGLLGTMVNEGRSLRINNIKQHDLAVGFPEGHPHMRTLLGVPIKSKGEIIGDLYLADKISSEHPHLVLDFDDIDQKILEMFATQAAIAIENATLYRQVQELVVLRERERFGMDLHDGIIQSIYAVGLMLEDIQRRVTSDPENSQDRITNAISGLNDVISDLRNYILDLRPQRFRGKNLSQGLEELARSLRLNTLIAVNLETDGINPEIFNPEQTVEVLHVAQEAITNIRKHARASQVDISLEVVDGAVRLLIEDNGRSIKKADIEQSTGSGLHNMRERANSLGGKILVEKRPLGGTRVDLSVPILSKETA